MRRPPDHPSINHPNLMCNRIKIKEKKKTREKKNRWEKMMAVCSFYGHIQCVYFSQQIDKSEKSAREIDFAVYAMLVEHRIAVLMDCININLLFAKNTLCSNGYNKWSTLCWFIRRMCPHRRCGVERNLQMGLFRLMNSKTGKTKPFRTKLLWP